MKTPSYADEFLRIAEYVETVKNPARGLYSGKVFVNLNIPVTEDIGRNYRSAVDISINEISPDGSYFDPRLDPAVRPLLFCFLHAILSSGDSLQ
jgi:hypothetical protein